MFHMQSTYLLKWRVHLSKQFVICFSLSVRLGEFYWKQMFWIANHTSAKHASFLVLLVLNVCVSMWWIKNQEGMSMKLLEIDVSKLSQALM